MINLEPLINKHFQNQEMFSKIASKLDRDHIYPTITVARDPGSGGKDVANKIAEILKVKCFDQEIMEMIAKESKTKLKLVKALDEKSKDQVTSIINNFLRLESMPENTFIKSLATVILSIAAHQPAVFLGRGANFILPPSTNFRIRVTAPRRVLVKYAMKYEGHTAKKARTIIDKYMKRRKDFVYKYFTKDISKAHYYDLVINTQYLTIDDAAQIAIKGFKQKFGL